MDQLILEISKKNLDESISLRWDILTTPPAFYWMIALKKFLKGPLDYFPRYTGFVDSYKNMEWLSQKMNEIIAIINEDGRYHIPERADGSFNQDFSNKMHHHFELLIGDFGRFTDYYKDSSIELQNAVGGLNHLIHDMETLDKAINLEKTNPEGAISSIIVEVQGIERFPLPSECDAYFSLPIAFGDLYLHYAQIGKTWFEVFIDKDEEIHPEAIQPLYALTAEFDAFFGEFKPTDEFNQEFNEFLKQHAQDPQDPSLRLGTCPVGKFVRDLNLTNREYKKLISDYPNIKSISLIHNDKVVAKKGRPQKSSYDYIHLDDL